MTTNNTLPFYFSNIENMTVAAVKAHAKLWADTFRDNMPFNNGEPMHGAFHAVLTAGVRNEITPENIDELEAKIVELTLSEAPIDDYEAKNGSKIKPGHLGYNRQEINVDYHASGVLRAALVALGSEGERGTIGRKLDLLVPVKSRTSITMAGIVQAFGYGNPDVGGWNTLKQVPADEYRVINRFATDRGKYGEGWERPVEEGVGELVWVQLSRETCEPSVQIFKALGYVKTTWWTDPDVDYYWGNEGGFAYACSRVLQNGYLGLAVRK